MKLSFVILAVFAITSPVRSLSKVSTGKTELPLSTLDASRTRTRTRMRSRTRDRTSNLPKWITLPVPRHQSRNSRKSIRKRELSHKRIEPFQDKKKQSRSTKLHKSQAVKDNSQIAYLEDKVIQAPEDREQVEMETAEVRARERAWARFQQESLIWAKANKRWEMERAKWAEWQVLEKSDEVVGKEEGIDSEPVNTQVVYELKETEDEKDELETHEAGMLVHEVEIQGVNDLDTSEVKGGDNATITADDSSIYEVETDPDAIYRNEHVDFEKPVGRDNEANTDLYNTSEENPDRNDNYNYDDNGDDDDFDDDDEIF